MKTIDMMEGKEETRVFKEDERYKEKIVYKIIPVPYYYPVPVDAEWYHKNYERHFRPSEFTSFPFVDTSVEHFVPPPPPGFPYPRFRHPHHQHHFVYEPSSKRGLSPPPQARNNNARERDTSPKRPVHGKCNEDTLLPHVVTTNENGVVIDTIENVSASSKYSLTTSSEKSNDEINRNKDSRSASFDNIIIKSELEDNETIVVNGVESPRKSIHENSEIESIRDRKRYLMTFPYDQKKKVKVNGHSEPEHETVKHVVCGNDETNNTADSNETHYTMVPSPYPNVPAIPTGHKAVLSQTVPYVMVPVQNPSFLHPPKVVHPAMHQASFATEHSRTYSGGKLSPEINELKNELAEGAMKEDNNNENIKYHPNGRRARTVFTRQQLLTLNNVFEKHHFVSGERMSELSDQLGLDRKIVKIWFQNKRQYSRKKGSLLEREEDYFEYQDMDGFSGSAPPTMTMLNHSRSTMDDLKQYEENLYKVSVLSDDYKPDLDDLDYTDMKLCKESGSECEESVGVMVNYEHEHEVNKSV